jgi:hypothetical protein
MTDTPQYIKDIQLELWLAKSPGERLCQVIKDNEIMLHALREAKIKLGLPLGSLDPVGEYEKNNKIAPKQA